MKTSLSNIAILMSITLVTLVACSSNTQNQNMAVGAVTGALLGGVAGSAIGQGTGQLLAMGAGALAGGLLGGAIGQNMESSDTSKINNTLDHNQVRKTSKWKNKHTGTQYTMTPMSRTLTYKGHGPCRKYHGTATYDGKRQSVKGLACRQSNGTWQAVG